MKLGEAVVIVKYHLDDEGEHVEKVKAIEQVARMGTHNSVTKDELVHALRWIFDHYDFEE